MQKRRGGPVVLPVTDSDVGKMSSRRHVGAKGGSGKRRRRSIAADATWSVVKLLVAIVCIGVLVVVAQKLVISKSSEMTGTSDAAIHGKEEMSPSDDGNRPFPLDQFQSLQYALRNSEVVILYFGANWCPFCQKFSSLLDEHFGDDKILLPPPPQDAKTPLANLPQRHGLSLVYVSSDQDEEHMKEAVRQNWMSVPFNSDERTRLKQYFKTCAKREMEELQIERQHEIPSAIILSGETQALLTSDGVKDLEEKGAEAADHWIELAGLASALESKFMNAR